MIHVIHVAMGLVITAALSLSGCWFRAKPKPQAPAPRVQAPRATQTNPPSTPARKSPAKRKPVRSTPRAGQPAAIPPKAAEPKKTIPSPSAPPSPLPEPEDTPRFGRILTSEESAAYRDRYDRSAAAAEEILQLLAARALTPEKRASMERIRSFLAQAQESVASDLRAAANLANRAEVLARDLVRTLP